MRIIAGVHRSRVIEAVEGNQTRPTSDKIKEAIFSRIGPYFEGGLMLDLFAGSGNVSLEAISRGITKSILCDASVKAIRTIQKNVQTLDVLGQCEIWRMDYQKALEKVAQEHMQFHLVFLDPPYRKQQISNILKYLDTHQLVVEGGNIVCESLKEDTFDDHYGDLIKVKDVTYGITRITYYKKRSA